MLTALVLAASVDSTAIDSLPDPWLVWAEAPRRGAYSTAHLVLPAAWTSGADSIQLTFLAAAGRRAHTLSAGESCSGTAPIPTTTNALREVPPTITLPAAPIAQQGDTIVSLCVQSGGAQADYVSILLRRYRSGGPAVLHVVPARLRGERSNATWWDRPFVSVAVGGLLAILGGAIASLMNHWSAIRLKETEWTGTLFEHLDAELQDLSRLLNQFVNDSKRDPPKLSVGGFAHILKTPMLRAHLERRRGSEYLAWLRDFYTTVGQYGHGRSLWLRMPAKRLELAEQMRVHANILADKLDAVPNPEAK